MPTLNTEPDENWYPIEIATRGAQLAWEAMWLAGYQKIEPRSPDEIALLGRSGGHVAQRPAPRRQRARRR